MVDVITDNREQVHQTSCDTPKRCCATWQSFSHLLHAAALEAGIVRDHRSSGLACPDQALREHRPRIFGPVGEPLVVSDAAVPVSNVAAELDRHRVVGVATLPYGDGETHRLEV